MLTMLLRLVTASTVVIFASVAAAQASAHRKGPNGLEGWVIRERIPTLEDQGPLPTSLVIARHGKVIRHLRMRRDGGPFYWNFVFWAGGEEVAFEQGPLHFNLTCTLMRIKTGERIQDYDCFSSPLSDDAPEWVKQLEGSSQP